ncbi:hypothetical protein MAR_020823, partial [Mya arenaria]
MSPRNNTNKQQFINMLNGHLSDLLCPLLQTEPKKSRKNRCVWNIKVFKQQLREYALTSSSCMRSFEASLKKFITVDFHEQATVFGTLSASTANVVTAGKNAL